MTGSGLVAVGVDAGMSSSRIGERLGVDASTVRRLLLKGL